MKECERLSKISELFVHWQNIKLDFYLGSMALWLWQSVVVVCCVVEEQAVGDNVAEETLRLWGVPLKSLVSKQEVLSDQVEVEGTIRGWVKDVERTLDEEPRFKWRAPVIDAFLTLLAQLWLDVSPVQESAATDWEHVFFHVEVTAIKLEKVQDVFVKFKVDSRC